MKKTILIGMLIILASSIYAQTEQGSFMVSGSSSMLFNSGEVKHKYDGKTQGKGQTVNTFQVTPSIVYFIANNFGVGLTGAINNVKTKEGKYELSVNSLSFGAGIVYIIPTNSIIKPILQGYLGFEGMNINSDDDERAYSGLNIGISGGAAIFILDNVSLNLGLSYNSSSLVNDDDDKGKLDKSNMTGNVGFSFFF